MKVVSNASPLIILAKLNQLYLLHRLYREILIPREVYNEVVVNGLRLSAPDAKAVEFLVHRQQIQVIDVTYPNPLPDWSQAIDLGETEVILLATQTKADWAIIDNAHARRAARQVGVPLKGTIGLLLEAFRKKHLTLPEFELLISTIKSQPTLWISERLCDEALAQARKESQDI